MIHRLSITRYSDKVVTKAHICTYTHTRARKWSSLPLCTYLSFSSLNTAIQLVREPCIERSIVFAHYKYAKKAKRVLSILKYIYTLTTVILQCCNFQYSIRYYQHSILQASQKEAQNIAISHQENSWTSLGGELPVSCWERNHAKPKHKLTKHKHPQKHTSTLTDKGIHQQTEEGAWLMAPARAATNTRWQTHS